MVCTLVYSGTNGAVSYLTMKIFDEVFAKKDETTLTYLPFAIIGIFAFRGAMFFADSYLTSYVSGRVVTDLRNTLHDHIQSLSLSFFHRQSTGLLVASLTNNTTAAAGAVTGTIVSLVRDSTSVIVLTVTAFLMDARLALIAFIAFPASVLPLMNVGKKMRKYAKRGQSTLGGIFSLMQESIQGTRIVKAFGMEDYEKQRFRKENERLFKFTVRMSRVRAIMPPTMELLAAFGPSWPPCF